MATLYWNKLIKETKIPLNMKEQYSSIESYFNDSILIYYLLFTFWYWIILIISVTYY